MVCPYCNSKTDVTNSRHQKRPNQVWRRRRCLRCKSIFTSYEALDLSKTLMVGTKPFSTDLLFTDVLLALQDVPDCYIHARAATTTVISKLLKSPTRPRFTARQISRLTAEVLKRLNHRAWLRYVAEHPSLQ